MADAPANNFLESTRSKIGMGLFFGVFILIGTVALGMGIGQAWQGWSAQSWPTTSGVITHAETVVHVGDKSDTVGAEIYYRYVWEGQTFQGDQVRVGGDLSTSGGDFARDQVARYPVGAAVQVSVNPDHPEIALLEPGLSWPALFLPGFGLAFIVIPSLVALGMLYARRKVGERDVASLAYAASLAQPLPGAEGADWTPLERVSWSSFRSSRLKHASDGSLHVVATPGSRVFASLFLAVGVGIALGFGNRSLREFHDTKTFLDTVGAIFALFPVFVGLCFAAIGLLLLLAGNRKPVFDWQARTCRRLRAGTGPFFKTHEVPFSAIRGLQLLRHDVPPTGDDSGGYTNFQLNLVLKDGRRFHVMGCGDPDPLKTDARALADALCVPLWVRT